MGMEEILPEDLVKKTLGEEIEGFIQPEYAAKHAISMLGEVPASGLFLRGGSASFKYIVRYYGKAIGINSLQFRLQPQKQRLQDGVEKLTGLLVEWQAAAITIDRNGDQMTINARPATGGTLSPVRTVWLHFIAGLFQEFIYWAGGGKQYPFKVTTNEMGGSMVICFQLQPMD